MIHCHCSEYHRYIIAIEIILSYSENILFFPFLFGLVNLNMSFFFFLSKKIFFFFFRKLTIKMLSSWNSIDNVDKFLVFY